MLRREADYNHKNKDCHLFWLSLCDPHARGGALPITGERQEVSGLHSDFHRSSAFPLLWAPFPVKNKQKKIIKSPTYDCTAIKRNIIQPRLHLFSF